MKRTVSAVEARQQLGEILSGVYYRGDEVVIERAGKSMAVVIPIAKYEAMQGSRDRFFEIMAESQARNVDTPNDVIEREIEEAIREVRSPEFQRRRAARRRK